jgi:hypothetical protein
MRHPADTSSFARETISDTPLSIELPAGIRLLVPPEAAAGLEAALRQHRRLGRPRRDLAADIKQFLTAGPATVPEIARAIGARDSEVRHTLQTNERFARASAAADHSARAKPWMLASSPAGVGPAGGTSTTDEGL